MPFSSSHDHPSTPPPQAYQPTHDPSQPDNCMKADTIRRWAVMLLLFSLTISLIISLAWLILKPQPPHFTVNAFTIPNISLPVSQLTRKYGIEILITNPNKKLRLCVSNFSICGSYGRTCLSNSSVTASLHLDEMSQANLSAQLKPDHCQVKKKEPDLHFKMLVSTTFEARHWFDMERSVVVSCENLKSMFLTPKSTGKPREQTENCVSSYGSLLDCK